MPEVNRIAASDSRPVSGPLRACLIAFLHLPQPCRNPPMQASQACILTHVAIAEDKPLTARQAKFAHAVAEGKPRTVARRENYSAAKDYPKNNSRKASDLARKPHVAAEIRRLTWLSCPPADDIAGMRQHAIRVISDLSRSAKSEAIRLKSALALLQIAEATRQAASPRASDAEQDKLLESLRRFYDKIQLVADNPPLVLGPEDVDESDDVIDIAALGP